MVVLRKLYSGWNRESRIYYLKNLRISVTIIHFTSVAVKSEIRKTSASMTQQTQSNVVFLAYQEVSSFLELIMTLGRCKFRTFPAPITGKLQMQKQTVFQIRPRGVYLMLCFQFTLF